MFFKAFDISEMGSAKKKGGKGEGDCALYGHTGVSNSTFLISSIN